MLVFNWQTVRISALSYPEPLACAACREPRRCVIDMTYAWCGIFYVCGIVYQHQIDASCGACGRAHRPVPPAVARYAARAIPWRHRHGLMTLVTVILVFTVLMSTLQP